MVLGLDIETVQGDPAWKEHGNKGPYSPHPCWSIAGSSHWPNIAADHAGQCPGTKADLREKEGKYGGTGRSHPVQNAFSEPLLFFPNLCDVLLVLTCHFCYNSNY